MEIYRRRLQVVEDARPRRRIRPYPRFAVDRAAPPRNPARKEKLKMATDNGENMLHRLQDIREHVYRLQEKVNTSTPLALFEMLAALVALCDQAIDLEIRR
jgi:predicted ATPase